MTLALALAVVAITGFISLSYEILWFRAISFVTGSAPTVFGLLLGFYLGGLAIGSFASGIFCRNLAGETVGPGIEIAVAQELEECSMVVIGPALG